MIAKTVRKCSICRKPGHTKLTCKKTVARTARKTRKNEIKPPVIVRFGNEENKSEHVVNLRPSDSVPQERVTAFREAYENVKPTRQVLNVAGIVRQANQLTKIEQLEEENKKLRDQLVNLNAKDRIYKTMDNFASHRIVCSPAKHSLQKIKRDRKKITIHKDVSRIITSGVQQLGLGIGRTTKVIFHQRAVSAFLALLLIVMIPFPTFSYYKKVRADSDELVLQSTSAFLSLQSSTIAALQADIPQAQLDLNSALESFSKAQSIVDKDHQVLTFMAGLVPVLGKQVKSRQYVLRAGHYLALGNTYLVKGIQVASTANDIAYTDRFAIIRDHLRSAIPQYRLALEDISRVENSALPVEYQKTFDDFKVLFATFINDMDDMSRLIDVIRDILGTDGFKRYLVMFQNHHEIRPTGGFLGSFALVDVQKGKITHIEVPGGGTYDLQGQLAVHVKPPLPLQLVNGRWEFQDSNWFPDFPASAKKMEWFYENGRGTTVDGVIAINASVLERFLRVSGPISSDKYDLLLNPENALAALEQQVEVDYDKTENKPKAVIADLLDQLLTGLKEDLDATAAIRMLAELNEAANQKEIQIFLNDEELQKRIQEFGWTGEIEETPPTQDYIMVVNTNLQGQKSDAKIEQYIDHTSQVQPDGSIINTVKIRRKHSGVRGEAFYGRENINFMRLYVPKGSELLDATGFVFPPEESFHVPEDWYKQDPDLLIYEKEKGVHIESGTRVTEEFGKTVFGNWSVVQPGQTSEVSFIYRLPMKIKMEPEISGNTIANKWKDLFLAGMQKYGSRYSLFVQKQSGVDSELNSKIIYPDGWTPVWRSQDDIRLAINGAEYSSKLEEDQAIGVVMQKN